ncbi:MAG: hypothetical protein ABIJ09_14625 [Pseudomonadota bacterium]
MTSIRPGALRSTLQQLQAAPSIDRAGMDRALDAALADGRLTRSERAALGALVALPADRFDAAATRQRLQSLLSIPDDGVLALAHKLTRDDGVLDIRDAGAIAALIEGQGSATGKGVASLRALMIGSKMTRGAERRLERAAHQLDTSLTLAADPQEQQRLDKQRLRTVELSGPRAGQIVAKKGLRHLKPPPPVALHDVKAATLLKALDQAAAARLQALQGGGTPPARICPEDGSLRVRTYHMAMIGADQTGDTYVRQMAQIGKIEGFNVAVRVPIDLVKAYRKDFDKLGLDNVQLVGVAGEGDFWSEDQGELDVKGNVKVPAPALPIDALYAAGFRERIQRLYPDARIRKGATWEQIQKSIAQKYPDASFSMVGAIADRKSHEVLAGVALAKGTQLQANLCHIEGGNLLVGTRADGSGYALVGKDSLAHSRAILQRDLGRPVADDELRAAVAHDLGIAPEGVIPVEQPGDFHIDMHMSLIKPGEVMVNDVRTAARRMAEWRRADHAASEPKRPPADAPTSVREQYDSDHAFWKELGTDLETTLAQSLEQAEKRAVAEERTIRDIEAAGLTVHRVAGVYQEGYFQNMNFMNAEQGQNARGERYYIPLGGDPRAEQAFIEDLRAIDPGIARVHFLDRESTQTTLSAMGGISCRCKAEGELA